MRHRLWQLSLPFAAVWALCGCTDSNGSVVELQYAVIPDNSCAYQVANQATSSGFFDPVVTENPGYQLAVVSRNNMEQASDETYTYGSTNIHWRTRDAIVNAWEVCWESDPNVYSAYTQKIDIAKGPLLDCAALAKAGKGFTLPGSSSIVEGGLTQSILLLYVLTPAHLKTLFGPDFDAKLLPIGYTYSLNGNDYYAPGTNAAAPDRPAAWGTFPASGSANVVVQLRARWTTQGGEQGVSNWMVYPIEVCPGCSKNACGPMVYGQCYGCKGDTLGCNTANKCNSDGTTPCQSGSGFSGIKPHYGSAGAPVCLIEQGFTPALCDTQGTFNCAIP